MVFGNPSKVTTTNAKKEVFDPWLELVTHLRKKGPEVRNAVMAGVRVDFFRGKDFVQYLKENQDLLTKLPQDKIKGNKLDEQIESVAVHILRSGVFFRSERSQKVPKPGKKLLKFPKRLDMHPDPQSFSLEGFYVWRFTLPTSPWNYLGSVLLVVVTIACCLFPLSPHWVKLSVLYLCLSLLGLIFFICVVRAMVFGVVWVLLGKHLWLLPNLFADDVGIFDAFLPWYETDEEAAQRRGEESPTAPSLVSRLLAAGSTAATLYLLYTASPEPTQMAAATRSAHKSILELLDLYEVPKQLDGGTSNNTNQTNLTVDVSSGGQEIEYSEGNAEQSEDGTPIPPPVEGILDIDQNEPTQDTAQ